MSSSPQLPHSYHLESAQAGHSGNHPKHTPQILYTGNLGLLLCFRVPFFLFLSHMSWHLKSWKHLKESDFCMPWHRVETWPWDVQSYQRRWPGGKDRGCSSLNYYFQKTMETPNKVCKWWVCSKHSVSYYVNVFCCCRFFCLFVSFSQLHHEIHGVNYTRIIYDVVFMHNFNRMMAF